MSKEYPRNLQYYKFCMYGFLKNLRFFDPFLILFFINAGLSFLQIGTLYAIREISTNILEIPTGIAADSLAGQELSGQAPHGLTRLSGVRTRGK